MMTKNVLGKFPSKRPPRLCFKAQVENRNLSPASSVSHSNPLPPHHRRGSPAQHHHLLDRGSCSNQPQPADSVVVDRTPLVPEGSARCPSTLPRKRAASQVYGCG